MNVENLSLIEINGFNKENLYNFIDVTVFQRDSLTEHVFDVLSDVQKESLLLQASKLWCEYRNFKNELLEDSLVQNLNKLCELSGSNDNVIYQNPDMLNYLNTKAIGGINIHICKYALSHVEDLDQNLVVNFYLDVFSQILQHKVLTLAYHVENKLFLAASLPKIPLNELTFELSKQLKPNHHHLRAICDTDDVKVMTMQEMAEFLK